MAVSAARARTLALSLEEATEAPHFNRTAFRTPRRIFATLGPTGTDMNFMFDPELRDFYCERSGAFTPVPGGWGRMGATRCDLTQVDESTFVAALKAAHTRAMAPTPKRAKTKS